MSMPKGLKEVGGQLVYDRSWHCSACRRNYRGERRTLIEFWAVTSSWRWAKQVVRLCHDNDATGVTGCVTMGIGDLFRRAKGQAAMLRSRREAA